VSDDVDGRCLCGSIAFQFEGTRVGHCIVTMRVVGGTTSSPVTIWISVPRRPSASPGERRAILLMWHKASDRYYRALSPGGDGLTR
jgi:hypothetical protein